MQKNMLQTLCLLFAGLWGCSGTPTSQVHQTPSPPAASALERPAAQLLTRPLSSADLVFPPPVSKAGHERPELELKPEARELALRVVAPRPEFRVYGQRFQVHFNSDVAGASSGHPAGDVITLNPRVVGQARWQSARVLEFVADTPFDPEETYHVRVHGIRATQPKSDGVPLHWRARFTANGPELAGKALGYLPQPDHERVVALSVGDGDLVARRPKFQVLYDQPVSLSVARRSVHLRRLSGSAVPIALRYARQATFRGYRVPPRQLIEVVVLTALGHGEKVELSAEHAKRDQAPESLSAKLEVATDLVQRDLFCGYRTEVCEFRDDGTALIDQRRLMLGFNHPLSMSRARLRQAVHITPSVRNFGVDIANTHDSGGLILRGDFRSGVTYHARVAGITDRYDNRLDQPLRLKLRQRPLSASLSMSEGPLWLDDRQARNFEFTSRNVHRAQLWIWQVDINATISRKLTANRMQTPDAAPFSVLPIDVVPTLDEFVTSSVDLSRALTTHQTYYLELRHSGVAFEARPPDYQESSAARRPPSSLVTPGGHQALAVHVHNAQNRTLVHVAELASGLGVPGARVSWTSEHSSPVLTNKDGVALLPVSASISDATWLRVDAGPRQLVVPARQRLGSSDQLFPELTTPVAPPRQERVVWNTDRGVYRPGETLHLKASVFQGGPGSLEPLTSSSLRLEVVGPTGRKFWNKTLLSNAHGSVVANIVLPDNTSSGHYVSQLYLGEQRLSEHSVRVAPFVAPRFVVDIEAPKSQAIATFRANVQARYLFGAPLGSALSTWSLTTAPGRIPAGEFSKLGLTFQMDQELARDGVTPNQTRTGGELLDERGRLTLELPLSLTGAQGPLQATLQAEVADESHRTAAARHTTLIHPFSRYAGLKVDRAWYPAQQGIDVELGVIDRDGKPVSGAGVRAVLEELQHRLVQERGTDGTLHRRWRQTRKQVASCSATSAATVTSCKVTPDRSGPHLLTAWVDGHPGGGRRVWVSGASHGSEAHAPRQGNRLTLVADKENYQPGDTARVLLDNPFAEATALTTLQGSSGLLEHRVVRLRRGHAILEFPLRAGHTPFVHATVSLLAGGKHQKPQAPLLGALRLPVEMSGARLDLQLATDKARYLPGEGATIELGVTHQGKPAKHVELAVAVVDEGVLRLTNFHAPDPAQQLWTGAGLKFSFFDTRSTWSEATGHSHVAGDGGGAGATEDLLARRDFVHTALWKPQLEVDKNGRAHVALKLPDNLSEFRVLAVAIDRQGRSATAEHSFQVTQDVLLDPVLPRFAKTRDRFEVAAILHNTGKAEFQGSVSLLGKRRRVVLAPGQRQRVGERLSPTRPGKHPLSFELRDARDRLVDRVERTLDVSLPGAEEKPRLTGNFTKQQQINLRIPANAQAGEQATLRLVVGENLHPELGAQLEFLLGYPHGCVEQTTSSTLPLIAARQILPLLGMASRDQNFFDDRIEVGLKRLNSMRTHTGGLSYWPGGNTPNVFGTAYAMRAVVASRKLGIALPPGLDETMLDYLRAQIFNQEVVPEVRSAIALSLAESQRLRGSDADPLFDLAREVGVFGKANLALALDTLASQSDRVQRLLAEIEAALVSGEPLSPENREDLHSFSSDTRALAQASLALNQLKPRSQHLPPSIRELLGLREGYTTQATAYRLLALAEHVSAGSSTAAGQSVSLDGKPLTAAQELEGGAREYRILLSELVGQKRQLTLSGPAGRQLAFSLDTNYRVPVSAGSGADVANSEAGQHQPLAAVSGARGTDLYRIFTTPDGDPVDLSAVKAGELLRVALLVRRPERLPQQSFRYLAITDALPAGFEPVDTSLDTVAEVTSVSNSHPFHSVLSASRQSLSHLDLRDDKVSIYFDSPQAGQVAASYLVRATTVGNFDLPRARAELMYEPDSVSFTESARVVVQ